MIEPIHNDSRSDVETFVCPMCHHETPVDKALSVAGRRLCSGCASTWYEDDEESDDNEKP